MPNCGSQCLICCLPIRFDTYRGCSHACSYCFASRKIDISNIRKGETINALKKFVEGNRTMDTNWCDWNIPLHWGGLSDPFQPIEKEHKLSLECLKYLAETKYPFVVSTKGKLIVEQEYLDLLKECNVVVQVSMVASIYDKLEKGAPTFTERLKMLEKLSKVAKRVIVRSQPYMLEAKPYILRTLNVYKSIGVYGIIIEGLKSLTKLKGMEKLGADFVYPLEKMKMDFLTIKNSANSIGLKVFAGENRIRNLGDSLNCCGTEGLEGFTHSKNNLNYLYFDSKNVKVTKVMQEKRTANCFASLFQETIAGSVVKNKSFNEMLIKFSKNNAYKKVMGLIDR